MLRFQVRCLLSYFKQLLRHISESLMCAALDAGTNQTLPLRQSDPAQSEDAAANCGKHDNTSAIYEFEDDVPVDTCLGFTLAAVYGDDEEFCSSEQGNGERL